MNGFWITKMLIMLVLSHRFLEFFIKEDRSRSIECSKRTFDRFIQLQSFGNHCHLVTCLGLQAWHDFSS